MIIDTALDVETIYDYDLCVWNPQFCSYNACNINLLFHESMQRWNERPYYSIWAHQRSLARAVCALVHKTRT